MSPEPDFAGAMIALNRFGYGPRGGGSGDLRSAASDPRGYVRAELARPALTLLAASNLRSMTTLFPLQVAEQEQRNAERNAMALAAAPPSPIQPFRPVTEPQTAGPPGPPTPRLPSKPSIEQEAFNAEALARLRRVAQADCGFAERLVAFWSNHFAVSIAKSGFVRMSVGAFEREAIRPHVFGRFADMLKAVEQHPTMLHYLDNQQSVGPNSRAARNSKRGLNENLAREIMELHTLGVGGGYSQADVTSLAAIITGWTIVGRDGKLGAPGSFAFAPQTHEPGAQVLLGKTYADTGLAQGEDALLDLARRPSTATFIATKLARHFTSDNPPPSLVEHLRKTFTASDGDLGIVSRALIDRDEVWRTPLGKMRSPYDYHLATLRLFGRVPEEAGSVLNVLSQLGQPLWQPPGPNGFSDLSANWMSPQGMKLRLDSAAQMGQRFQNSQISPGDLLDDAFGAAVSAETREAVGRAESKQQGFALLLMSPEFQRR
jgi:uncharacterized protein (DUF1800 family)